MAVFIFCAGFGAMFHQLLQLRRQSVAGYAHVGVSTLGLRSLSAATDSLRLAAVVRGSVSRLSGNPTLRLRSTNSTLRDVRDPIQINAGERCEPQPHRLPPPERSEKYRHPDELWGAGGEPVGGDVRDRLLQPPNSTGVCVCAS